MCLRVKSILDEIHKLQHDCRCSFNYESLDQNNRLFPQTKTRSDVKPPSRSLALLRSAPLIWNFYATYQKENSKIPTNYITTHHHQNAEIKARQGRPPLPSRQKRKRTHSQTVRQCSRMPREIPILLRLLRFQHEEHIPERCESGIY